MIFEVSLKPVAKGLAKILPIKFCDGIINLQINKSTCDFLSDIFWQTRLEKPLLIILFGQFTNRDLRGPPLEL